MAPGDFGTGVVWVTCVGGAEVGEGFDEATTGAYSRRQAALRPPLLTYSAPPASTRPRTGPSLPSATAISFWPWVNSPTHDAFMEPSLAEKVPLESRRPRSGP